MAHAGRKKLDPKIIHSLDKGLEVLERVAESSGNLSLTELTQQLGWDKATVFRLLTTLIRRGYVEQDADTKHYGLGFRVLHVQQQLFKALDLPRVARDTLTKLALETGETAHLATLNKDQVVIIVQKESASRMAVNAHVGTSEPLHCTALGKAILMQLSGDSLKRMIEGLELTAYTANTITSREWLFSHIEKASAAGYATDEEEFDPQVRCIAAPVPIQGSPKLYAIGISGPAVRVVAGRMPMLIKAIKQAAQELCQRFQVDTRPPTRT